MVDSTLSQHAHRAQLKRIAPVARCAAAPAVRADRRALEHVLGNLIDNALKYCPEGAAVQIIAADDNGMVRVAV